MALALACGKKPATASADAEAPAAASGPRIMPPTSADYDQLLPDVPAGYAACTASTFDPRIDAKTADERKKAWQAEAAAFKPLLHPVDVRAAYGTRNDDNTPDDTRPEGIARFTLPRGVIEMRFPGRLSTIRTARRAAQPQYERQPGEPFTYVLAPLGAELRVLVGDGWISRHTDGISPAMDVDAFLVKESVEETTQVLVKHAEHAVAAVTCALEEGMHQRGAYRVASSTEPDGAVFVELGATAGDFCEPNSTWHALIGLRRVGDATVVMAFKVGDDRSNALCKSTLRAVLLR